MYAISKRERHDIIRLLSMLRSEVAPSASLRQRNMLRVAGLLIEQLQKKKELPNVKQIVHEAPSNTSKSKKISNG